MNGWVFIVYFTHSIPYTIKIYSKRTQIDEQLQVEVESDRKFWEVFVK